MAPDDYLAGDPVGTFDYLVEDGQGGSSLAQVTLSVIPVNDAPEADSGVLIVQEESQGNPLRLAVGSNPDGSSRPIHLPGDGDGDALTISISALPTLGVITLFDGSQAFLGQSVTLEQLAAIRYDAPADYNGVDLVGEFGYRVDDGQGLANSVATGTITLVVQAVNDAPAFQYKFMQVEEASQNTPLDLGQPFDEDGDPLMLTVIDLPILGSVLLADGTALLLNQQVTQSELLGLTYTAPAEYNGQERVGNFTLLIEDGKGGQSVSLLDLGVTPLNDAPVVDSLTLTVDEGSPAQPSDWWRPAMWIAPA